MVIWPFNTALKLGQKEITIQVLTVAAFDLKVNCCLYSYINATDKSEILVHINNEALQHNYFFQTGQSTYHVSCFAYAVTGSQLQPLQSTSRSLNSVP
jgi:hypothetical protein